MREDVRRFISTCAEDRLEEGEQEEREDTAQLLASSSDGPAFNNLDDNNLDDARDRSEPLQSRANTKSTNLACQLCTNATAFLRRRAAAAAIGGGRRTSGFRKQAPPPSSAQLTASLPIVAFELSIMYDTG